MTDNQKFVAGLVIGVAAGAAAAWFLSTDKGKEFVSNAKEAAGEAYDNLKNNATRVGKEVETYVEKGKEYVHEFTKKPHDGMPA